MTELRQFPRIVTDLSAQLKTADGVHSHGLLSNLSPGGAMVRGDLAFKEAICPHAAREAMQQQITVELASNLPGEKHPLVTQCRLVYVRRLAQDAFELGLRFIALDEHAAAQLHRFIFNENPPSITQHPSQKVN